MTESLFAPVPVAPPVPSATRIPRDEYVRGGWFRMMAALLDLYVHGYEGDDLRQGIGRILDDVLGDDLDFLMHVRTMPEFDPVN